jgi:hypothetical protein
MSDAIGRFWLCQKCAKHVPARQTECRCGFSRTELAEVPFEVVGGGARPGTIGPSWFAVGPTKLVVMSVVTLGFYQIYWFYQQWRRVRDAGDDVWPLPRSLFGVIFGYSLFERVVQSARALAAPAASASGLAVAYIFLCLSSQLPLPYGLLALLSALPLAAVQRVANAVAERDFPDADPNRRLTAANWAGVGVAGAFLAFLAYAAIVREKPTSIEHLSKIAAEVNRQQHTPSDGIVLDRVDAREGGLVYYFNVALEAQDRMVERKPRLKELMVPRLCRDALLKQGVSVRFVYNDTSGQEIASADVGPHDCGS